MNRVYKLTKAALVEAYLSGHIIYGRWDWVFGCWLAETAGGPLRAINPTWRLLAATGEGAMELPSFKPPVPELSGPRGPTGLDALCLDHFLPQDERSAEGPASADAIAAFQGYVAAIPRPMRDLAAPFGVYQWVECRNKNISNGFPDGTSSTPDFIKRGSLRVYGTISRRGLSITS
jgi:hypothetical protein